MPTQYDYDIIIVGGGLVGASLAVMLRDSGFSIALVEAFQHDHAAQPSYDDRTVALSWGSRLMLETMGLWSELQQHVQPISTIHISDKGHLGVTRLHHHEEGVEALGYVAENRRMGKVLFDAMSDQANLTMLCPASVTSVADDGTAVTAVVDREGAEHRLSARCLVAADGVNSSVRDRIHMGSSGKSYGQSAIVCNLTPGKPHQGVAYERFTDQGPVAFLPMSSERCSVVWSLPVDEAKRVMALNDDTFLAALQARFGHRLGRLRRVGARQVYPLMLRQSAQFVRGRTVVMGNAAHTIHPVAGQGFNLALRDVSTLVDVMQGADDPGAPAVLQSYQASRLEDTGSVYRFTDALIRVFSNDSAVMGHARAAGLLTVDMIPGIKHALARQSMGLAGRVSSHGRI